ncbi:ribosome assembly cofactor RimP [Mycoplasmopsis felis]|uniref:Ribosome maturation factor RimP N-terminal domain-containing protein n=1 Tax=Mycoplasmopsis felis TaxID=33923 RepID=A0A809RU06_9BACT|nr:ribosome assembly cofactor RimP [Mycoplasmopsis felis]WQQ04302.1 ribosome assembly cofactor RimP [Mycoplasmopsis felis]WQQ06057.1 ribosome assembly cofactor RimP [Mycoplasmopsis felis]WQQ07776.1 ribosome assembly cofactor RimP [Mycoplasmopsis felis]WQQ10293.1 ribosome assembly cofactor RimP [Mycoplasmopsis felis]WQQ11142.1 ribosome assembly cofactor RimP [Mycoplasmopsis felis]
MNYKEILENEFGSIIIDAKLVKNEFGNTLEIITSFNNLSDVENISKKISVFLDSQKWFKDDYNLEVLSKGQDTTINIDEIEQYKDKELKIQTIKSFEGNNSFIVKFIEQKDGFLVFKWNKKGQFRKIQISKDNISNIEIYIKF